MKIKCKNILIICIALLAVSTSVFSNQDSKTITQEKLSKSHKPPILTTAAIIEVYDGDNQFQGIVLIEIGKAPWGKALPGGKVE